jgi:long-chain acyl-CoA synthetase
LPKLTLRTLYSRIEDSGKRTFLDGHETKVTYSALKRSIDGFCGIFDERSLREGDRFLIVTGEEDLAVSAFLAAMLDGLVPVMLSPDSRNNRIASIAALIESRLVLTDANRKESEWARSALIAAPPDKKSLLDLGRRPKNGVQAELTTVQGRNPRCPEDGAGLAYILFTSGTTSQPKGVKITRRNICANLETISEVFEFSKYSRIFNGLALAHADGLVQGPLLAVANRCTLIRPGEFNAASIERYLNIVRSKSATHFITVPTVYSLIDRYALHDDYFDTPEFKALLTTAAKMEPDLWDRLQARFSRPVYNQYGLTETVACALYAGDRAVMGRTHTIGKPIDCEAKLVRQDAHVVDTNKTGELWLRGENIFSGYYRNPEATASALSDGWLRTGDLAMQMDDGSYQIKGRLKTTITSGGLQIQPEELNEACLKHSAVTEAVTVGLPDPDFGEIAVTAVTLSHDVLEEDLTSHCRSILEPLKVPKRIVPVTQIPRGISGKPILKELEQDLIRQLNGQDKSHGDDLLSAVLTIAAKTFRVPRNSLQGVTSVDDIGAWDSFAHINFILQCEQAFSVRLPTSSVAAIRNLQSLADEIRKVA